MTPAFGPIGLGQIEGAIATFGQSGHGRPNGEGHRVEGGRSVSGAEEAVARPREYEAVPGDRARRQEGWHAVAARERHRIVTGSLMAHDDLGGVEMVAVLGGGRPDQHQRVDDVGGEGEREPLAGR